MSSPELLTVGLIAGALVGGATAAFADERTIWPRLSRVPGMRVFRPGLTVAMIVGAATSGATLAVQLGTMSCGGSGSFDWMPITVTPALAVSTLTVRLLIGASQRRLLRAAVLEASAAPAAHPHTVEALASASAAQMYAIAAQLAPRVRRSR